LDYLENLIQNCCSGNSLKQSSRSNNVDLSNSIILNQNDPNPFAEETRITFTIPESIRDAKIVFFDKGMNIFLIYAQHYSVQTFLYHN